MSDAVEIEGGVMGGFVSAIALDVRGYDQQVMVTVTDSMTGATHTIMVSGKEARRYYIGQYAEIVIRLRDEREVAP